MSTGAFASAWPQRVGFARGVALLALLGFALRAGYALTALDPSTFGGDADWYHHMANRLADGHGFEDPLLLSEHGPVPSGAQTAPTAFHPPLFPALLALVSLAGGRGFMAHELAGCAMGAAMVALVAVLGRELAGARAGLIAGAVAAVSLPLIGADAVLMSESLFGVAIAACLLAAVAALRRPSAVNLAALGVSIGLAALTRGEGVLLLAVLAAPVAWRSGAALRGLGIVALVAVLVVAPWTARNWVVFHRPVLVTTTDGAVIAGANARSTYYGQLTGFWDLRALPPPRPGNEAAFAEDLRRRGVRYAREHAGRAPVVVGARILRTLGVWPPGQQADLARFVHGQRRGYALAAPWFYLATLAVGLAGFLTSRRRLPELWILLTPLVLVTVASVLAYGDTRFRVPFDIALAVLCGVAADAALRRRRASRADQR